MERKGKDTYRVECPFTLSDDMMASLMCLYQPLTGGESILVYMTLIAESRKVQSQDTHARLYTLINITADAFDRACAKLEEYMLMRTYYRETDSRSNFIYVLHTPLPAADFLQSSILAGRYMNVVGKKQMDVTRSRLLSEGVSKSGYRDITREVRFVQENETDVPGNVSQIRPRYQFAADDVSINFDYDQFIKSTSTLVFPAELRSQENMALIGKLATVYGLSVDRMRILVKNCVNLSTMEFDGEKLRLLASKATADVTSAKDVYSLSPVSFLQAKQNGARVSMTDRKILEHLAMDMNFPNEVINVMIEYILRISDNRLNSRFVDMVAGEWARDGIRTKEQALMQTKKDKNRKSSGKAPVIDMPEYIRRQEQGTLPKGEKASDEMVEKIRKLQEKMKD